MPARSGPKRLYKYRSFNVNTLRLLNLAEIHYADPKRFNDPLDCDPTLLVDCDLAELERLLFRMLAKECGEEAARGGIRHHRYMSTEHGDRRTNPVAAKSYVHSLASEVNRLVKAEFGQRGVLSLAARWDCPLMWSHYGDEHRGLCLEFDMTNTQFENLQPVSYASPRAVRASEVIDWKVRGSETARRKIESTFFFAKAPQWRYEREWRDVSSAAGTRAVPARVSAVVFGLRCDATIVDAVVRLHNASDRSVKFYAIRSHAEDFGLQRYAIDVDEVQASGVRTPTFLHFPDLTVDEPSEQVEGD